MESSIIRRLLIKNLNLTHQKYFFFFACENFIIFELSEFNHVLQKYIYEFSGIDDGEMMMVMKKKSLSHSLSLQY